MQMLKTRGFRIIGAGLLAVVLALLILFSGATTADEQAFLPADQVTTSIQTAVSNTPGKVGGVEVETEGGKTLVESYVQTQGGQVSEVAVNPQTNQVVSHEEESGEEGEEKEGKEEQKEEEGEKGEEGRKEGEEEASVFLSADRVTAAIQTAVSDTPGKIGGVEVETEGGKTLVESYVQTQGGQVSEVAVNPRTNQVVSHEEEEGY